MFWTLQKELEEVDGRRRSVHLCFDYFPRDKKENIDGSQHRNNTKEQTYFFACPVRPQQHLILLITPFYYIHHWKQIIVQI